MGQYAQSDTMPHILTQETGGLDPDQQQNLAERL